MTQEQKQAASQAINSFWTVWERFENDGSPAVYHTIALAELATDLLAIVSDNGIDDCCESVRIEFAKRLQTQLDRWDGLPEEAP